MDQRQQLNHRQLAWLVGTLLIGGDIIGLPHALYSIARSDAWFSQLVPVLYGFLVVVVFVFLARRFPNKNIFEITIALFGKLTGGIANGLLLFYLWTILARDLTGFYQITRSTILASTPLEMILLIFIAAIMFYGKSSVEVPARVVDFIFPIFILLLIALPLLLLNELNLSSLEPVLAVSPKPIVNTNIVATGWYADIFVAGAFLQTLNAPGKLFASLRHGIAISGLSLTFLALLNVAVLGSNIAAKATFSNYTLIQQIHITDFLDRLDIFVFSTWVPVYAIKVIFIYQAFLYGLASFTAKKQDYRPLNKAAAWFLLVSTIPAFTGTNDLFAFGNYSSGVIALGIQIPLMIALIFFAKKVQPGNQSPDCPPKSGNSFSQRISPKLWIRMTHLSLAAAGAAIIVGIWLGRDLAIVGSLCGAIYFAAWLGAAFTTFMEVMSVRDH